MVIRCRTPNGYTMAFLQAGWVVLKGDILKVFRDFQASGKLREALIYIPCPHPKIPWAVDPMNFCSINLVGSIYKIIAKTLVNKLKMVLEKIISKSQNAFIRGMQ
ncbi:hypothetical protein SLA2020_350350 [Shorea laevis]